MLGGAVPRGAIFYHASRTRREVRFDDRLRRLTLSAIEAVRAMLAAQQVPPPVNDARCPNCSLRDACLPQVVAQPARLRGLQGALYRAWDRDSESEPSLD